MFSELIITDGTIKIDLLSANKQGWGWGVTSYIMGRAGYKDGGVWRDSPVAVGRQLAQAVRTNFNDALTLNLSYRSQREIINAFEEFDLLLEKSAAYWLTTWQQTPIYIQAQVHGESARRYALVYQAMFDRYFDPYAMPYLTPGRPAVAEVILGIERGPWLDLPPGEGEPVPVTNDKNSGDPFETDESFHDNEGLIIGNMSHYNSPPNAIGGVQSIIVDDGGVFGTNLLDGSPPYYLIPDPQVSGDTVYFGGTRPFFGLVFDLQEQYLGLVTIEFWNGSTWATLSSSSAWPYDAGVQHLFWLNSSVSTWATTTVGADATNRYWVRIRTTNNSAGGTIRQLNRHVYATATNYVEVQEEDVRGTLAASARIKLGIWYGTSSGSSYKGPFIWLGLRSVSRGSDFVAHLNVFGGNPPNVTVNNYSGGGTLLVNDTRTPGGKHIAATNKLTLTKVAMWTFSNPIYNQYYGQYRLFARLNSNDDTGESRIRFRLVRDTFSSDITQYTGETKTIPASPTGFYHDDLLIDLGYVAIPSSARALYTDPIGGFSIVLDVIVPAAATLQITGLVMMPIDEWTAEVTGELFGTSGLLEIHLDGITNPKGPRAWVYGNEDLLVAQSANPFLHAGATQRLWSVFDFTLANGGGLHSNPVILASVQIDKAQRNLGLRR